MKRNIVIKVAYDGTRYHGWQIQKDVPTVQGEIKKAIEKITGERVRVQGASRTDGGVHAFSQVANFFTYSDIPAERFKYALNSCLPPDIRVLASKEAPLSFNARRSESIKTYKYIILEGEMNPILRNYVLFVREIKNREGIKRCAELVKGEHDFKNFTPEKEKTKRIVIRSEIKEKGSFLIYEISGYSFLRYMVRNIVGAILMVGLGKMTEDEFEEMLVSGEEKPPRFTAPPHALYLAEIKYKEFDI